MTELPGRTDPNATAPSRAGGGVRSRDRFRDLAAAVSAVQALSLLGFVAFYLWELAQGATKDAALVIMSALLILVFAAGIGVLARSWWTGANWPNTPTVVWNLLLLPVSWSLFQAGRGVVALALAAIAVTGIVSAVRADTSEPPGP
ncbi:MAG: hypothetical protein ABIQ13_02780 [Pedococcus sp.]